MSGYLLRAFHRYKGNQIRDMYNAVVRLQTLQALPPFVRSMNSNVQYKVGFIGLGNMGSQMASRLIDDGHCLVVYDTDKTAADALASKGAVGAPSPAELAATPGLAAIITMLPGPEAVMDVYCDKATGVFSARNGVSAPLLLDCSTVDPATSRVLAASALQAPLSVSSRPLAGTANPLLMDAPVSGGTAGAAAGTLTFMCGGRPEAFDAARPILSAMGKRLVHCGGSGSGQAAKLCNNLVLAIQMAGVSEGMALGRRLGLDPALLADIFNSSTAACWSSGTNNPCPGVVDSAPASRGYEGGFGARLMVKDLGLAISAAELADSPVPVGSLVQNMYQVVCDEGHGPRDFSSIFQHVYGGGLRREEAPAARPAAEGSDSSAWSP
uniref:3-hydroxyisobutyrate dehydrogenase n=1 Tax=Tetraselmis sp. GSL018 TaxID=582737 RepID=A0A061RQ50_9CHLO|mmetsp:Transcript_42455/g.100757  ORF Transcript_42455/g.100757 Transcript_42455/m.100757 type:complete len:382 (-) Transcript_42455:78-1223(-)